MKPIKSVIVEEICPACNGTGFLPVIKQPAPGKRIYPPRCAKRSGRGRITRGQPDLNPPNPKLDRRR